MKSFFIRILLRTRRFFWSLIVAYMLGLHNFYKGEEKTIDNINSRIEAKEEQGNGVPE